MDRFQVCLGYFWYMLYGYEDYADACDIGRRLDRIGFKPGHGNEGSAAMDEEENWYAKEVFDRLCDEGYFR